MADLDPAVSEVLRRLQPAWAEHESRMRKFDTAYDIYRASEVTPRGQSPWQSKLRVKYGMQVIDTALVNIVSGNPRIMIHPRRPQDELAAKKMQALMDYYVSEDHLVEKQPTFVQQGLVYGVSPAKNHWLYREAMRPVKTYAHNPFDPTTPYEHIAPEKLVVRDGPTFEPWNVYHCYWEPGARDVDSAAYVVLQSYLSKEDLQQLAFNPSTGQGIYHNVDKLLELGDGPQPKQTAQARAIGLEGNRLKGKFLIEEVWTDDELVVIGNKQIMLRRQPNPYWHGHKPVVVAQTRPDLFEMVGVSETELVDHLQQASWTLQNMVMDNLHLTVQRGITYREGGVTDPNMLELRPRFKWPVSDHDDIRAFEVQPISTDVFTERQRIQGDMQLVTGINPYVSGGDSQGVDQNTATGITALQEVASRLLRFKASQIQNAYQRSFEMWGDMAQQFLDKNVSVQVMGQDGKAFWDEVTPQNVVGHFAYKIEGSEESLSRQQERGEAIALLNAFAPLFQLGIVNPKPILERVALAHDFPNPEALFNAPPPQQPPAAPFNPQMQQQQGPPQQAQMTQGVSNALATLPQFGQR